MSQRLRDFSLNKESPDIHPIPATGNGLFRTASPHGEPEILYNKRNAKPTQGRLIRLEDLVCQNRTFEISYTSSNGLNNDRKKNNG